MFVFLRRLAKMSLFFWSCFASSKRPQLGEFGDPHLLCFFQPRGTPACSSDAPQGNANLPGFAYLSPACGSAHWEMHESDTLWRLARGDVLPGRSRTHIPPALLVICVPGLRLLCRDRCWCSSYSRCSFLHGSRARAEPGAMPKPLCRHLCQQTKVQLSFLHRDRDPHGLVRPWLDCWFTVPQCIQTSPGRTWIYLKASPVPQYPFKTGISGPHEEVDKEVRISGIVLFGGFLIGLRNFVRGRLRSSVKSSLRFGFSIK